MGVAVRDMPSQIYGIVDLYGAAIKASINGEGMQEAAEDNNQEAASMENTNSKYSLL